MVSRLKSFLLATSLLLLYSCGYIAPKDDTKIVEALKNKYEQQKQLRDETDEYISKYSNWYLSFHNQELEQLIKFALQNNTDLQKTALNLQAAAYQLGEQRKDLMPDLGASAGLQKTDYSKKAQKHLGVSSKADDILKIGFTSSYEVDIWGKNYSKYKSAKLSQQAKEYNLQIARLSVVTSVMNLWINLMAIRETEKVLNTQFKNAQILLKLQKDGYASGNIKLSNLLQQKAKVLGLQSEIEEVKNSEKNTLRSINIILGRDPLSNLHISSHTLPSLDPLPSEDLNIVVLADRPDVKEAFYNMIASKYKAKAAQLSRLPSLNLKVNLQFGVDVDNLSQLLDAWVLNIAGDLLMPIFYAGSLSGQAKAAKLLSQVEVIKYKDVLYNAVKELQGALESENMYKQQVEVLKNQSDITKKSLSQVTGSYLNGGTGYSSLLLAFDQRDKSNLNLIDKKKKFLLNRVILYKAIGIPVGTDGESND